MVVVGLIVGRTSSMVPQTNDLTMTTGYYQTKKKGKKTKEVGTLVLDKVYFGLRIKKNTGTDSPERFQAILSALAYLKRENEREAFIALRNGTATCLEILEWYEERTNKEKPWKVGNKSLSYDMNLWLEENKDIKERTKESYKYHVRVVVSYASKFGDAIHSLPRIVEDYKNVCRDKMVEFNRFRSTCLSYASQLPNGRDGEIWKNITKVKPYKKKDAKRATRYNPFTPLEIDNLFKNNKNEEIKQLIYWLCLTGIRPEEYTEHGFKNLGNVVEIYGDKTSGSYARLVPKFFKDYDPQAKKLGISYWKLRKLFQQYCPNHTPRDTRRTFAVWCQKAGIERNHITSYMGHIPTQLDDYQRQDIVKNWANEDRKKLEDYIKKERTAIPKVDDTTYKLPTSIDDLGDSAATYSIQQIKDIINDWLKANHPKHIRKLYKVEKLIS